MGLLVLETEAFRLTVEGTDTPDSDPLVLQASCLACGAVVHTRVLVATQAVLQQVRQLAETDATQALAHQILCRAHV